MQIILYEKLPFLILLCEVLTLSLSLLLSVHVEIEIAMCFIK